MHGLRVAGMANILAFVLCAGAGLAAPQSNLDLAREHNRQGIALQSQGKLQQAADEYKKAIGLNPDGAGFHNNLALALKDLDELDQAEIEARTALKLRPERPDYHYNLGIILQRQNKLPEALAE